MGIISTENANLCNISFAPLVDYSADDEVPPIIAWSHQLGATNCLSFIVQCVVSSLLLSLIRYSPLVMRV